jgi:hypothetical protein
MSKLVVGSYEHGNETSCVIKKDGKFDYESNSWFHRKDPAP